MPANTESLSLSYFYQRHEEGERRADGLSPRREINIIDLGLIAPDGTQVGVSGSDKTEIHLSETYATPGYRPCSLVPGEWRILLGAYKVAQAGVTVRYELSFTPKRLRLFKGDLHTHTLASDGVLSVEELAQRAVRHGLDFLAITDHNQMVKTNSLPRLPGLTLIPGMEWTHFKGHANFLGVDKPFDEPFFANDLAGGASSIRLSPCARRAHHHLPSLRRTLSIPVRHELAPFRLPGGLERTDAGIQLARRGSLACHAEGRRQSPDLWWE